MRERNILMQKKQFQRVFNYVVDQGLNLEPLSTLNLVSLEEVLHPMKNKGRLYFLVIYLSKNKKKKILQ